MFTTLRAVDYTRYNVRPTLKRYIKYLEKEHGRICRKIWIAKNPQGQIYMYANFCVNYDRLIITLAYFMDPVGWIPMEIGK